MSAPNVTPAFYGPDNLRGLGAASNISAQSTVVSMPFTSGITVIPFDKCPFSDVVDAAFYKKQKPETKMALALLYEKSKGTDSKWKAYLDFLPAFFDTPAGWDKNEINNLQYKPSIAEANRMAFEWQKIFGELKATSPQFSVSYDDFCWSIQAVQSRLFSGPYTGRSLQSRAQLAGTLAVVAIIFVAIGAGTVSQVLNGFISSILFNIIYDIFLSRQLKWYAMLPFVDLANHKSGSLSEVSYQYFTNEFVLEVGHDYKEGDQVLIQYGEKTNDQLLAYYGFFEENNPIDTFIVSDFTSKLKASGIEISDDRLNRLREFDVLSGIEEPQIARNGFQKDTLQAVRILMASENDLQQGLANVAAKGSFGSELMLYELLIKIAKAELDLYPTTIDQDVDLLKSSMKSSLSRRESLAIAFRTQKKKLLAEGIKNMEKRSKTKRD